MCSELNHHYGCGKVRVKVQTKIITIIHAQQCIYKILSYPHHLFLIFNKFELMIQYLSLQYEAVMVVAILQHLFCQGLHHYNKMTSNTGYIRQMLTALWGKPKACHHVIVKQCACTV